MTKNRIISFFLFLVFVVNITLAESPEKNTNLQKVTGSFPTAKIMVFADPHYYDPELGTTGAAFEMYLAADRKLIRESEAILNATIDKILNTSDVDLVLVPGDLTKDGEKQSHEHVAAKLQELVDAGIKVCVVPGNHDVNNGTSYGYTGDTPTPVPTVSADEFATIYANCGYGDALYRDPNSLSYVSEPVEGLWIIGIDACLYEHNEPGHHSHTGGALTDETSEWIQEKLNEAKSLGKTVFGVMHHGVMEHYDGQTILFAEYVINNWQGVYAMFADMGMNIVFTGHYHAQDIRVYETNQAKMFDIETGSSVTYPCPVRTVELDASGLLSVSSEFITSIDYDTGDLSFPEYALNYLQTGLQGIITVMLMGEPYNLTQADAVALAPLLTSAFVAHYMGDEVFTEQLQAIVMPMLGSTDPNEQLIGQILYAIFNDPLPEDNTTAIDLASILVPVELTTFSARYDNNTVVLSWSTATETNNRGFEVQRSLDNKIWATVGFKEGNGSTSEQKYYTYTDKNIFGETIYYRLKQIDYDGTFEYSQVVEVATVPNDYELTQNFPNPFNPSTTISYGIPEAGNVKLSVFNNNGEEIAILVNGYTTAGRYEAKWNGTDEAGNNVSSGVYFYTLATDKATISKKMMLVK